MIQILGIRKFFSEEQNKKVTYEAFYEKGLRAASVEDIFLNPEELIQELDPSERYNLYYTLSECLPEKGRKFLQQHHVMFDIDGIEVKENEDGSPDMLHIEAIARTAIKTLGVLYEDTGVVYTGNGVQFIIGVTKPFDSKEDIDNTKIYYKECCRKIDLALSRAGLQGHADPVVWSPARLCRYPNTKNVKPNRKERMGRLLQGSIKRVDFSLERASGVPQIEMKDQISLTLLKTFPTADVEEIMHPERGCKILYQALIDPNSVSEAEWYANMSITTRFPNGVAYTHNMSKGYDGYSFDETQSKIEQTLASPYGPRTCANMNIVSGGKCAGCKHFGTELISPVKIVGKDFIKTKETGFYYVIQNSKGTESKVPCYEDLIKYLRLQGDFMTIDHQGTHWRWNSTHWDEISRDYILKFAQDNFNPAPNNSFRNEFYQRVRLYDLRDRDFFHTSTQNKLNFKNGVFDLKNTQLVPHSTAFGFRHTLPMNYDPTAKCPNWDAFIDDVMLGREELKDIVQEFVGYLLCDAEYVHHKCLALLGSGSNGKSTFVKVIRALVGRDASSSVNVGDMNNPQNRYVMEGKLVNFAEENDPKRAFQDTSFIKNFTSGGDVMVKKLYSQPYEYRNTTKLIMLFNELPENTDTTLGFFRRFLLVPFDAEFSEENNNIDHDIEKKLFVELPGILNWAIEGYRRLLNNGRFTQKEVAKEALKKYAKESGNTVDMFLDQYIEVDYAAEGIQRQTLYDAYREFCDNTGIRFPETMQKMTKTIKKRILKSKQDTLVCRPGTGDRSYSYKFIKFNDNYSPGGGHEF